MAVVEALYDTWILYSVMCEIADEVLVCGEADRIQGMVTIQMDGTVAHIGLIAVDAETRGKGLGTGLVRGWRLGGPERDLADGDRHPRRESAGLRAQ